MGKRLPSFANAKEAGVNGRLVEMNQSSSFHFLALYTPNISVTLSVPIDDGDANSRSWTEIGRDVISEAFDSIST